MLLVSDAGDDSVRLSVREEGLRPTGLTVQLTPPPTGRGLTADQVEDELDRTGLLTLFGIPHEIR